MFSFTLVAAALVAYAHTNPIEASALDVTTAASFPRHDLTSPLGPRPTSAQNGTLPAASFQGPSTEVADAIFPAVLLLCSSFNCANCLSYNLQTTTVDTCLATSAFSSVSISQPSNQGLPFAVYVGPSGCTNFAKIPVVNTCFNLVGGSFSNFLVLN
ncbi:uncharacterized protein BXZ73DRAFT_95422 [Epithele typhae]|uniref:uncharacterized protein n=1 Tax=Epithele typhae TaxID=378194 RepID=UPI002007F0A0|nr:uncharacterized protein BXZ73DRAFT_95422 [Epithele typhae]KAH9945904.1 hypothetical protein BXZ73DRAFT_95422 [Epithele typhae]